MEGYCIVHSILSFELIVLISYCIFTTLDKVSFGLIGASFYVKSVGSPSVSDQSFVMFVLTVSDTPVFNVSRHFSILWGTGQNQIETFQLASRSNCPDWACPLYWPVAVVDRWSTWFTYGLCYHKRIRHTCIPCSMPLVTSKTYIITIIYHIVADTAWPHMQYMARTIRVVCGWFYFS